MPGDWLCFKKSLNCCSSSKSTDVNDPRRCRDKNQQVQRRNPYCFSSGFSRSSSNLGNLLISNVRDDRILQNPSTSSPRSLESCKFLDARNLDVLINHSNRYNTDVRGDERNCMVQQSHRRCFRSASSTNVVTARCPSLSCVGTSLDSNICDFAALICRKCCHKFKDLDAFEVHYLSKHAVIKLVEGDFSRKTVELICQTGGSSKSGKTRENVLTILKVHNMPKTIAEFEDYRDIIKIRASKLPKKHPRCLADGNELLGFHGTTLACSLGLKGSLALCVSDQCGVCRILRHGFSVKTRSNGFNGILTTSTSSRALECIEMDRGGNRSGLKALVLCRVIAGRVHKPLQKSEEFSGFSGFDSLAAKMGRHSNIEELYLLNTKALLPCFVVMFKC